MKAQPTEAANSKEEALISSHHLFASVFFDATLDRRTGGLFLRVNLDVPVLTDYNINGRSARLTRRQKAVDGMGRSSLSKSLSFPQPKSKIQNPKSG
jgi:hypothetical protein